MIARELLNRAHNSATTAASIDSRRCWTYSDLSRAASSIAGSLHNLPVVKFGIWCSDVPTLIATLIAADAICAQSVSFSANLNAEGVARAAEKLHLSCVLTDAAAERLESNAIFQEVQINQVNSAPPVAQADQACSRVILFTSGTSGAPKPAVHTWGSLSAGVTHDAKYHGRKWMLAYDPTSFAGIQVWLQALLTGGCVCVPPLGDYPAIVQFLIEHRVEFASATPTFWRLLLHSASPNDFAHTSLVQITLGGEAVDQALLDALRHTFPKSRITHIYASTEMGSCFAVHDGLAGFPATLLDDQSRPVQLRISEAGELEVRSRRSMLGYFENAVGDETASQRSRTEIARWFPTGDLVERHGDRIHFVGRKSETINSGGMKVYPLQVEECIRTVDGVESVRVYGISSSLMGQLVCAEVQPAASFDEETLRRNINAVCRSRLARQQIPALIKFNHRLAVNGSTKLVRSEVLHGG